MLHYMPGNDYRRGKRQVSFVVDESLWLAVRAAAVRRGTSMTSVIRDALLSETAGEQQEQPDTSPAPTPDWSSILRAGALAKGGDRVVYDVASQTDPLEEIA